MPLAVTGYGYPADSLTLPEVGVVVVYRAFWRLDRFVIPHLNF